MPSDSRANLNTNYNISDKINVNLIGNASFRRQKAPGTLGSEMDFVSGEVKRDFDINPYSYAMNTSRTLDTSHFPRPERTVPQSSLYGSHICRRLPDLYAGNPVSCHT